MGARKMIIEGDHDQMTGRSVHRVLNILIRTILVFAAVAGISAPRARAQTVSPPAQSAPAATVAAVYPPSHTAAPAAIPSPAHAQIDGATTETPGELAYRRTADASVLDKHNWALMAYKQRHQLILYYQGRLYKTYHAVFGRSPESGTKLWAGDRRTPEGLYVIVKKYPSRRWKWFLRLNYPNKVDRNRYEALREQGIVPISGGRPLPEGNAIGIHGTDMPILNQGDVDWTTGCISVDNQAITELDRLVPIGTMVVIEP